MVWFWRVICNFILNVIFKHVSGYILVKIQHVSKSKILGGILREVSMSADDTSFPRIRLTTEVGLSALPSSRPLDKGKERGGGGD